MEYFKTLQLCIIFQFHILAIIFTPVEGEGGNPVFKYPCHVIVLKWQICNSFQLWIMALKARETWRAKKTAHKFPPPKKKIKTKPLHVASQNTESRFSFLYFFYNIFFKDLDYWWLINRAGEPEPGVFGSLEPEPIEKKKQEPARSRLKIKSGAGAAKKLI